MADKQDGTGLPSCAGYTFRRPCQQSYAQTCFPGTRDETSEKVVARVLSFPDSVASVAALSALHVGKFFSTFTHETIPILFDASMLDAPLVTKDPQLVLIFQHADTTLANVLTSRQALTPDHVQYFVYQLLMALKVAHSAGVCHGTISPSTIDLMQNCDLRLRDFHCPGLPWPLDIDDDAYVRHTGYTSPEVLLGMRPQAPSDIWVVGEICGYLLLRVPFTSGRGLRANLTEIITMLGSPSEEDVQWIENRKAREFVQACAKPRIRPLNLPPPHKQQGMVPSETALDFLDFVFQFNPAKRPTAAEALKHPYFAQLYDPDDAPDCPCTCPPIELPQPFDRESVIELVREECNQMNAPLVKAAAKDGALE
mmetsp:Transcript_17439/g.41042  ORF Transcript_17439/g.41042 Transcript_17439/m.41042 type:complete len:368 (-) Transcript_17439:68-1171(-)